MKKLFSILIVLLVLVGCGNRADDDKKLEKIVLGGTSLPHANFLRQLKDPLKELGYELKVIEFDDYVAPNQSLENGELDANYFQHIPYLTNFNEEHGTDLVPVLKVHYEPIAIYAGTKDALDAVSDGDIVVVPDDATNLPRALKLLEELEWITLNDKRDTANLSDIVTYNVDIEIRLVSAENAPKLLESASYGVVNANYALVGDITDRGLQAETIDAATIENIVNVVAVRRGEEESDKTKAILEAFKDPAVVKYISETYAPAAVSVLD